MITPAIKNAPPKIPTTIAAKNLKEELYELVRNNERIFEFIQDFALDGLWFWDLKNPEHKWMNKKFLNTLGYLAYSTDQKASWQNIIHKDDLELVIENITSDCENFERPYDQVIRYNHKSGNIAWMQCKGLVICDKNGQPHRMLGAHTDVSHLERREVRLQAQVDKYKHIIDASNIGMWEWNLQTGVTVFNTQMAILQGYSPSEMNSMNFDRWSKTIHPDSFKKSRKLLRAHFSGHTPFFENELHLKHKDGSWIWVRGKGKVISWTASEAPEWIVGSYQEITADKKELLTHTTFIEQAPTAIAMLDTNMCYLACSQKWLTDYKIKETNIIGKSHYEIFPEIGDAWKQEHQDSLRGKTLKSDEDSFVRLDGTRQWISWELRPWYTTTNEIGGVTMHTVDITALKTAENKLRLSEETFRGNFENAAIGMAILNVDGHWIKTNTALCDILGYTEEELQHKTFKDITHPKDSTLGLIETKELLDGKRSFFHIEKRYLHKNGCAIHTILSTSLVRDIDGNPLHYLAQINDISSKIVAETKMQSALTRIEGLFEASSQVSIIATDVNGVITAFNKGAENLLGYKKEEVILKETPAIIHIKEEIEARGKELSELLNKKVEGFDIFTTMSHHENFDTREWSYRRKDGSILPVQLTVTAIKEEGEITGYLGVASDISKIKAVKEEIRSLLDVTRGQNERLLNFAHIVSHNLKSHSGNFCMLLNLFLQEHPDFEDDEIITMFNNASDNLSETIMHLNEVVLINTSVQQGNCKLNMFNAIEKVKRSISAIQKESSVEIQNLVNQDSHVNCIPAYLDSILLNFLTNGIKYRYPDRNSHVILKSYVKNDYLVLSIEDNGIGIDLNKNGDKLFGMYKTFHYNKDARGIGLFITKNQVEALGGKIEVSSKINVGTTFKIYLKYEEN